MDCLIKWEQYSLILCPVAIAPSPPSIKSLPPPTTSPIQTSRSNHWIRRRVRGRPEIRYWLPLKVPKKVPVLEHPNEYPLRHTSMNRVYMSAKIWIIAYPMVNRWAKKLESPSKITHKWTRVIHCCMTILPRWVAPWCLALGRIKPRCCSWRVSSWAAWKPRSA